MKDFRKVNVAEYVAEVLQVAKSVKAEKFARIIAKQGTIGEEVISWSIDTEGNPIKEKTAFVKEGDWIATKSDNKGKAIKDSNGHTNQWIITDKVFQDKYEIENVDHCIYKPTGGVQIFVPILENITLHQWGEDMNIAQGGWINITNPKDIYGISQRDFEDTYQIIARNVEDILFENYKGYDICIHSNTKPLLFFVAKKHCILFDYITSIEEAREFIDSNPTSNITQYDILSIKNILEI